MKEKEKELKEEAELKKEIKKKKFWHYFEETVVLICTILGVIISEAIKILKEGGNPTIYSIWKGWISFILSCIVAIVVYANLYTEFNFEDKVKQNLVKRITAAISMGIAWKTIIGVIE